MSGKKEIINILMRTEGYTKEEAEEVLNDTMSEVNDAISRGDYEFAEEIFQSDLGLEIDYLLELLV